MRKRILSFLLAAVMLFVILPKLPTEAKAHEIVMTAEKFVDCLWAAYSRPNYYYNAYPYNLGYYDGTYITFDCWNLGKAIIWTKGEIVNNYTVGYYAPMDASCGLGDWDGLTIIKEAPNCNSDFSELVPGEWLYKDGHTGYYVGDGQVIECTPAWGANGITISQIDEYGRRSKNGVSGGSWLYHGMVPWLDYSSVNDEETWIEKACFDVMVYRDRNADLADLTDAQLKEHWLEHGIAEGRASSTILDLKFYLNNNPDLQTAFGTDYTKVYNHFITSGYKERRKSSALFDGSYYCNRYPEVEESFKDEYLRHYVENGMKEGRRASLTFDPNYYWFIRPDVYEAWPGDYSMAARHYAGHGINAQIEAYDHEHPVVSNVQISEVSAKGYTITCTVTDNWGISKVAFPTWTVANNQDDLPANFMNTQLGTKNGSTYTFRVNASEHNNELGQYVTHIYAVDKGGNQTKLVLDVVQVEDQTIKLVSGSCYARVEAMVVDVMPETTAADLLAQFENEALEILDAYGNKLGGSAIVGTGAVINLYYDGAVVDSVTLVVVADVDGNGIVDTTDYTRVRAQSLGKAELSEAQKKAADVDGNDVVNASDCGVIKAYFQRTGALRSGS